MQKDYIVLCDAERAKGFVRPYRDAYTHIGAECCGCHPSDKGGLREDVSCGLSHGHVGDHYGGGSAWSGGDVPPQPVRIGGCGAVTTMGRKLSETYARDPKFYSGTFCATCRQHFPLPEFVWTADGTEVGS